MGRLDDAVMESALATCIVHASVCSTLSLVHEAYPPSCLFAPSPWGATDPLPFLKHGVSENRMLVFMQNALNSLLSSFKAT